MIDDVVSVLERLEELLQGLSDDGRLLLYARDLTRLVAWLRTNPPNCWARSSVRSLCLTVGNEVVKIEPMLPSRTARRWGASVSALSCEPCWRGSRQALSLVSSRCSC
jgi:hypothetical protein